jgi:glyoxylase-like metal-dependent hydrolase (beta-lactamase superfamily II)
MAIPTDSVWRPLTGEGDVRVLKYSWGPASANALAVRLGGKGWLVVSPPRGAPATVHDQLADDGGVVALLAPNAYHYLGQSEWRRRFPAATSWAPQGALRRLATRSQQAFGKAEELAHELPPGLALVFPDGQKSPDTLLRVTTASAEVVWWLGDLFSNTTRADQAWWLRPLARLGGSGPGYRRNSRPELVYVSQRASWLASVSSALAAHPPTLVVPAHGDPVTDDVAVRTTRVLA